MSTDSDQQTSEERRAARGAWTVRKGRLGDPELESDVSALLPEERLAMVWPLTVQAWAFKGVDISELRLPRDQMVITRRTLHAIQN